LAALRVEKVARRTREYALADAMLFGPSMLMDRLCGYNYLFTLYFNHGSTLKSAKG
jgi:hypothetical protein